VSKAGLEDVVATSSAICWIDGDRGILAYCGFDIHDLAQHATFEEVCYLLWHRRLPTRAELGDLQTQLAEARVLPEPIVQLLHRLPPADGMDILRTLTSALAHYDKDAKDNSAAASYRKAVRLTGQLASLVAAMGRVEAGKGVVQPDPALSHAANFLYMLTGDRPKPTAVKAFDIALTLHADHELNASTFAARVTAATLSDYYSAITSALGALFGPLHGGANEAVMHIFEEIGRADDAEAWLDKALAEKRKIMGFGHRVYKRGDSRVPTMKAALDTLVEHYDRPDVAELYDTLESEFVGRKGIYPNLDYPSGPAYNLIGFDTPTFTPLFVAARITGWTAHIMEQLASNALIRPLSAYNGHDERHIDGYIPDAATQAAADRAEESAE
jgi:citrate synthase